MARADGFTVTFPFAGKPQVEHLSQESEVGTLKATSHYVSNGDAAFEVLVTRYPKEVMARMTPKLALAVYRDGMLKSAKRVIREREATVPGPAGQPLEGFHVEVEMPRNVRAFEEVYFYGGRSYSLGAGAPEGDPAVNATSFAKFVQSFRLAP
ncbi:hypothetical protein JYT28_01295 [Desulfobulbus sp. AH-315-M07]|nr:hypothetical protein [Desulfobulbus sp. AH-315-M07]